MVDKQQQLSGLYLISNDDPWPLLIAKLERIIANVPLALFQYRRKKVAQDQQLIEIRQLIELLGRYQIPLIINDNSQLADQFSVGVHLGQDDGEITDIRSSFKQNQIIGRTCLNSLALAETAVKQGADYVAFGAMFASASKPEAQVADLSILSQAKKQFDLPICAIGGIGLENVDSILDQGADLIAIIGDLFSLDLEHVEDRAKAWRQVLA